MGQASNSVVKNASWIIICRIVQALCAFVIGVFTARYLGPSNYGLISYAASVVTFFTPIMRLGFNATLVRELIDDPKEEGRILGTSIILSLISSVFCILGITLFSLAANPSEPETTVVCLLYSLTLFFQACEMTQYWFQAKLMSKYPSIVSLIAYIAVSLYKIYILIAGKGIRWFAVVHVIEAMIIAAALIFIYVRCGGQRLSFSFALGKKMFSKSKHFIISAMMVVIFQQTDRIMLKLMTTEAETGYYSAALTCIGITGFVFVAIIDSARPSVLKSKKLMSDDFNDKLVLLYSTITVIAAVQSVLMTAFAPLLIQIIFGGEFISAVPILQIAVWYVTFAYYGNVRNIWVVAENKQKYLLRINGAGALANVLLNLVLIPIWGGIGAAVASFVTQLFTNVVMCFVVKPIRPCGKLIIDSFRPSAMKKLFSSAVALIKK